jgi:hypothetical protein
LAEQVLPFVLEVDDDELHRNIEARPERHRCDTTHKNRAAIGGVGAAGCLSGRELWPSQAGRLYNRPSGTRPSEQDCS